MHIELTQLLAWAGIMLATGGVAGVMAGLLGVGGGIVIVPALFIFLDAMDVEPAVRMHVAVGTSLAIIVPTAIRSASAHFKRGSVDVELLKSLAPWLFAGVLAGTVLAGYISGVALTGVFAVVALIVAIHMALKNDDKPLIGGGLPGTGGRVVMGAVIGTLSTMMGIGGGTLTVPTLSAFGYPVRRAVGTASAVGAIIAIPGSIGFIVSGLGEPARPPLSLGYVNLLGLVLIFPMSMLMAPLGARFAHSIPPRLLRLIFAAFLAVTSARMFLDIFGS